MKKIMLIILVCGVIVFGSTGCLSSNKSTTINVTLKDDTNSIDIKIGKIITYSLLGDEYEFKITNITDNEINIEVNKYGLTNTGSLISKDKKFVIEKGKKLKLHTQTIDYQESIVFEY